MAEGAKKSAKRPAIHFAAGLATGVSSAALLQPADLLKTRLQQAQHTSLRQTLQTIAGSENGLRSLWRGTLPSVLRTGFGSALYFSSLDGVRRAVAQSTLLGSRSTGASSSTLPKLSNTGNLVSGGLARVAAGFVIMPLTVLKVRYESDLYQYRSLRSAASGVLRTEGVRGFFTGFGATALRDAPYAGLYVVFYEGAKKRLSAQVNAVSSATAGLDGSGAAFAVDNERPLLDARVAAGINSASSVFAAATATAITNPFDAVKTRLQLRPKEYSHMLRAATMMLREEGMRCMFDGLALRMARKALSSAIVWTLYEQLVRVGETRL